MEKKTLDKANAIQQRLRIWIPTSEPLQSRVIQDVAKQSPKWLR